MNFEELRSPKDNERFMRPVYKHTRLCQNPTVYKCEAEITNQDMIKRFTDYNKLKTTDRIKTMMESPEIIEEDDSKHGAVKAKIKAERFCTKQIFLAVQELLLFENAKLDTSGYVTKHRGTMSEFYGNEKLKIVGREKYNQNEHKDDVFCTETLTLNCANRTTFLGFYDVSNV